MPEGEQPDGRKAAGGEARVSLLTVKIVDADGTARRHAVISMQRPGGALRFVLVPVMHVALPGFYQSVHDRLAECDLLVVEGVTGPSWQTAMMTCGYRFVARRRSGLVRQDYATLLPPDVPEIGADITAAEAAADLRAAYGRIYPLLLLTLPLGLLAAGLVGPRLWLHRGVEARLPHDPDRQQPDATRNGRWFRSQERRNRRLLAELERIDAEHGSEPMSVAVLYGAEHIAEAYVHLSTRLGYRPGDPQWLTSMTADPAPGKTRTARRR